MAQQCTPKKKPSIGLTPVQEQLDRLRLSSGVRRSPRMHRVVQIENEGLRRRLFMEAEEVKGND